MIWMDGQIQSMIAGKHLEILLQITQMLVLMLMVIPGGSQDSFPDDASQWMDSDGDGYGDNLGGTNGDVCQILQEPQPWIELVA